MMFRTTLGWVAIATSLLSPIAHAQSSTTQQYNLSRFVQVDITPGYQQQDIRKAILSIDFDRDVELIGQAINHTLLQTGFALGNHSSMDRQVMVLLSRPLPAVHRVFTDVTLEGVLQTLVGASMTIQYDDITRTIRIVPIALKHQSDD
ncbi:hypothetical protein A1QO_02855 [Vibrio genomosp. F10 str. ZF-129]|uniref:Uncharacterized protein n=1 Tax=Vibrio genomosp. F10 str. ZF-129 TaxID=1187848 RepID=A0A1E5BKH2_9VIBR|nr:hypothetical protein [Vibrio genomosp. F10]OEE38336.1 hypothetical protein A1QO_02855 [Vibrio genomosp. F10 str. ZF-129]